MNISAAAIRRPVTTVMLMLALVFMGAMSYFRLGVDLFPDVQFPVVVVSTTYSGAGSSEVETLISKPIEEAVGSINGVEKIRSQSSAGASTVIIEFTLETRTEEAAQEVREKISLIRRQLPADIDEPVITRVDPGAAPIINFALGGAPAETLTELLEQKLKPELEKVPGVAAVVTAGLLEREVQVRLDPSLLERYGLSAADVSDRLRRDNQDFPSGHLDGELSRMTFRTVNAYQSASELAQLQLLLPQGGVVPLSALGEVLDTHAERKTLSWLDGKEAVVFSIQKQSGSNTLAVAEGVKEALHKFPFPPGVEAKVAFDTSLFIEQSRDGSVEELILGAILAVVVIFVFLRAWRGTIIAAIAIPTSIITTYGMMAALGFTLNMMTLMALSLVVGVLVDDAVVDLENIVRLIDEGMDPKEAAIEGTNEIGMAVVATTFSIVAVFLPIAFMQGMVGKFFYQFGVTVSTAVLVSLLVARTLTPTLCAFFLKPSRHPPQESWFVTAYRPIITWALTHRWKVVAIALASFIASFPITGLLKKGFTPQNDRDEFEVTIRMPSGTALATTQAVVQDLAAKIKAHDEVVGVLATAGNARNGAPDSGSIGVTLRSKAEGRKKPMQIVEREIQSAIGPVHGAKIAFQEMRVVDDGRGRYPINLVLMADDLAQLQLWTNKILTEMRKIPGIIDTDTSTGTPQPEIQLTIDRARAAELGVNPAQLAQTLRLATVGETPTKLRLPDRDIDVRVQLSEAVASDWARLGQLGVMSKHGMIPLSQVTRMEQREGPTRIDREDRQRQITLQASTLPGTALNQVIDPLEAKLKTMGLPAGMSYRFSGDAERMKESFQNLLAALGMAIIFIYIILASQFESFLHPITIMMALPLSFVGAFLGLFIADEQLGMMSLIGIVMLMGLVTKNAILLVDHALYLIRRGKPRNEALITSGLVRIRPILMTTIAMIAGMMPVALKLTIGAEGRSPMAVAVIGGLITSTLLTLVVVPVVFTLFDDLVRKLGFKSPAPEAAELAKSH